MQTKSQHKEHVFQDPHIDNLTDSATIPMWLYKERPNRHSEKADHTFRA